MSKLVFEFDVEQVVSTYLDHVATTRHRYELDGESVTLQTKRFDSGDGTEPIEDRASRARWSAGKKGSATEVPGGFLRLRFRDEGDVFFDTSSKQIARPAVHTLGFTLDADQGRGTRSDALDYIRRGLRYIAQTFEGRDVTFALDERLHDRLFAPERASRSVTVSSNAEAKLRLTFHRNPDALRFEVVDPASPTIWCGRGYFGKRLTLSFTGASVDAAVARKLEKHRKTLLLDDSE